MILAISLTLFIPLVTLNFFFSRNFTLFHYLVVTCVSSTMAFSSPFVLLR